MKRSAFLSFLCIFSVCHTIVLSQTNPDGQPVHVTAQEEYKGLSIYPQGINPEYCPSDLLKAAKEDADIALNLGTKHGFRNAQVTVVAPTGTIGLVMDCDTTGIEPDYALLHVTTVYPGTELYGEAIAENKLNDPKWYVHEFKSKEDKLLMSPERASWLKCSFDQKKWVSKAYKSFYFRPLFMIKTMIKVIKKPSFASLVFEVGRELSHLG